MTALSESRHTSAEIVREIIPAHGWILERRVFELAAARGVNAKQVHAALLWLACGDTEVEQRNGQMWIRWRSPR